MGRVERLVPGKDGLVRTVTLKTQKGRLRRPVQRLHRLEASTTQFVSDKFGDSGPSSGETPLKKWRRRWRIKQAMRNQLQVSNSIGEVGGMFGPETEAVDRLDPPYYGVS